MNKEERKIHRVEDYLFVSVIRARVNCPHHFHLSVKDMDGDRVRCRFARPEEGECVNCTKHDFIELNEVSPKLNLYFFKSPSH